MADLAVVNSDSLVGLAQFAQTSLILPDDLRFEDWLTIGATLQDIQKGAQWWLADWLNFGETHYPDRYTQALEATHYEERGSLHNIAYVGRRFPNGDSRHPELPFTHHAEVASLPAPVREELLIKAEAEKMTTRELRSEAIERKQLAKSGIPTWVIDASETGPDFLVADSPNFGAQVHPDGNVYLYDKAGRKFHIPDVADFTAKLYSLRDAAKRHFGEWPQK